MLTLYNVISQDGFIAREDGDEDFIPDELWTDFLDLCQQYDALILGRKTYNAVQEYPENLIEDFERLELKKVVVTRDENFTPKKGYLVAHSPEEAMKFGKNILLSSGPTLNTDFLEKGLIDKVIFNILPERINTGLKVFNHEADLIINSEKEMPNGRKWRVFNIKNHV